MYLLKLHKHKHGSSIYFTRDNMVCFPKSGHILAILLHPPPTPVHVETPLAAIAVMLQ